MGRMGVLLVGLLLGAGLLGADEPKAPPAKGVEGIWEGALTINGGIQLRLALKFTKGEGDKLKGAMDSIDQGAKDVPLDEVTFKDGEVTFTHKQAKITYTGKLNAEGTAITGTFQQGPAKLPLNLKRVTQVTVLKRPQEPKPPFPYKAEEVSYESVPGKVKLAATLTIPEGKGPFPAVVLITGSGPQNRNEELLGHKPFLVLADHLTRKGIAVLRADDRGVAKSTGDFAKATSLDFMEDALAGVAFLKGRQEIDGKKIGLCGHSEGGLIAPLAAVKSKDVAFIVLLAGPGLPGDEILYLQSRIIAKGLGAPEKLLEWNQAFQKKVYGIIRDEKDAEKAKDQVKALINTLLASLTDDERKILAKGLPGLLEVDKEKAKADADATLKAALEQVADQALTPWFRYFLTYDPRPTLAKVTCPVLAINGALDCQVPPRENLEAIAAALKAGGNKDVTTKELPGLNHLFQTCKTGLPPEYGNIEETIAPAVLDLIAGWILERK